MNFGIILNLGSSTLKTKINGGHGIEYINNRHIWHLQHMTKPIARIIIKTTLNKELHVIKRYIGGHFF
jgi:hypothetical protein